MFTLHPEVTGGVFLLNIHRNSHGCGTWHVPGRWKYIEGGVCLPYRTYAIHVPLLPRRKGLQLLSSFVIFWTNLVRELKLEGLSAFFLNFSFSLSSVLFLFLGTLIFWRF